MGRVGEGAMWGYMRHRIWRERENSFLGRVRGEKEGEECELGHGEQEWARRGDINRGT